MGLYYPPPLTWLGAAQPLTQKELTPVSGPAPSNPVFGAVSLAATLVSAWSAAQPLPQHSPFGAALAAPPAAPSMVLAPPSVQAQIAATWPGQLWPLVLPAALMTSGPVPQVPPVNGAVVPAAVLVSWLPPAPQPPAAVNLNPPIGASLPGTPIQAGSAVRVIWM